MSLPFALQLADWVSRVTFDDLPSDVVDASKLRTLDVIGLALAASGTPFGRSVRQAATTLSPPGPSHIVGTGEPVGVGTAAYANAALAQALEYDDTHNESIVHMSSPSVASALALSEAALPGVSAVTGRDFLLAVAVSNEIACRAGSVASGQFHKRGLHPTGLFAPFGVAYAIGKLLGLNRDQLTAAAGIVGSTSAGLLECWADGTQTKFMHSGFAAQNGIAAAQLAASGATGPARVFEGRFGFFESHLQDTSVKRDYDRLVGDLGTRWESRRSSFKPYPAAHVLHPYLDALFELMRQQRVAPADVMRIDCPVAAFIVGIVCEPIAEKIAPATEAHCRVSLQHTIAEALVHGDLGRHAYSDERRRHPDVVALAPRVTYRVDPDYPGPGRFKGGVEITMRDGSTRSFTQEHNRGSAENPMTYAELRAKFDDNASDILDPEAREHLADWIANVEHLGDVSPLIDMTLPNT
jgi:2-methylcitrate dehydratase PrpD